MKKTIGQKTYFVSGWHCRMLPNHVVANMLLIHVFMYTEQIAQFNSNIVLLVIHSLAGPNILYTQKSLHSCNLQHSVHYTPLTCLSIIFWLIFL